MPTQYLWHYTVGAKIPAIVAAGVLKPATAFVPAGEIPVVWFSARQQWEPTANKLVQTNEGQLVFLDFKNTVRLLGGGWRFGLLAESLLSWNALKVAARISPDTQAQLVRTGKEQGADPLSWFGSIEPVPLHQCRIERLQDEDWVTSKLDVQ